MKIREIIFKSVFELVKLENFSVERPSDESRGDFACNVAMVMAKNEGKNPRELAEEIVAKLKFDQVLGEVVDLERIEVAGPGFINFWINDKELVERLKMMDTQKEDCLNSDFMVGKKVLVEFSSPNIAKRFSVGHLRSTIIGQAIYNLYKHSGAEVTNDNHLGDWGTQFGMIVAAVEEQNLDASKMTIPDLESLYVDFNKRIEETPELKEKAREAFARLEDGDSQARKIWEQCIEVSMREFEQIYKKLGVVFERQLGESSCEDLMPSIIREALESGVATKGEKGALVVKFEKDGKEYMPPAMLQKSDGTTTYFTRDMATIRKRLDEQELRSDRYIYEIGGEQRLHMRQVFAAAKMLWEEEVREVDFVHVAHGLMTLPEGKMSTRKGRTIKLEDLLNRAGEEAKQISKDRVDEAVSEKIGLGAVKYNELRRSPESNYVFRWEEALSMEGNSGPYLQYVYVRTRGILERSSQQTRIQDTKIKELNEDERNLLRFLVLRIGDGEMIEGAAKNFAPHLVCQTLFEMSQKFNGFYDRNRVVGVAEEGFRLLLVRVVSSVIKGGLGVLGIEAVEKM